MNLPNLELITKSWKWLEQHKNDEVALGQFADLLIKNKPSLAKYRRKIILFLQKIDYKEVLFNGEIGKGKLEIDGVACCWEWNAYKDKDGYGTFCIESNPVKKVGAHRLMLVIVHPEFELDSEEQANHRCDNPPCCNPNHLRPGTAKDNSDDKIDKGRLDSRNGSNNGNAKLTDDEALAIFDDIRVNTVIAAEYGVSTGTISSIKRGERQLTDKTKSLPKGQNVKSAQAKTTAKVTKEIADEIIRLKATGKYFNWQLANKFDVSEVTIGNVLRGKNLKRFD